MDIFLTLFVNLLPLYGLIALGYVAGRFCGIERNSLANFAIYILMPAVGFGYIGQMDLKLSYALLPIFYFVVATIVGLGFLQIGKMVYGDSRANIIGLCASMGNTGYMGLPLALLLFDEHIVALYIFTMMGGNMYEATFGYYLAARGNFDVRQSLMKLAKFPTLYAIILGLLYNALGGEFSTQALNYLDYFKGAYVIVGMMIIGIAMTAIKRFEIGWRFIALSLSGKIILMPLLVIGAVMLDKNIWGIFSGDIHNALIIMSIVPPAANIAAFASQMNVHPEKAATTILLSTIFALFYIPLIVMVMGI